MKGGGGGREILAQWLDGVVYACVCLHYARCYAGGDNKRVTARPRRRKTGEWPPAPGDSRYVLPSTHRPRARRGIMRYVSRHVDVTGAIDVVLRLAGISRRRAILSHIVYAVYISTCNYCPVIGRGYTDSRHVAEHCRGNRHGIFHDMPWSSTACHIPWHVPWDAAGKLNSVQQREKCTTCRGAL